LHNKEDLKGSYSDIKGVVAMKFLAPFFLVGAATLTAVPAVAAADESRSFEHDGSRYSYSVSYENGVKVIRGTVDNTNTEFVFFVGKDRVKGSVDGKSVSFRLKEVKPIAVPVVRVVSR
jgi:hypothetical protein